ncbi:MAG: glutamyl-tRNA reductase [Thermoleophilia bacterium]|nr:glutamyl-tRNA reductase [Thermoleophilia bacterium]
MHLVLVGTSHHHAPVELRERLAFDAAGAGALAASLAAGGGEAVALATCNRVCLYLAHADADRARDRARAELEQLSGLDRAELEPALYAKTDVGAALHLFRVAAGLDSMVPGESQILGQVRAAFEAADRHGAAGPVLHRLFRQARHAGKRVRHETAIAENPASVSSAAAGLAARVFDDLGSCTVLLVGAGKMAELAAANLLARGVGGLVVANRSPERARSLAERHGGRAVGLDSIESELAGADVVIASTGSRGLVLTAERVERALRGRRGRPVFFIDIAVPRDLDPAINELDGCYLYDIDDLERVVAESVAGRREEAARAEAIVREEAEAFDAWQRTLDVVPAIAGLRRRAEEIRIAELARARARLTGLSPRELTAVESLTAQIVNKLLHAPTVRLKEAATAPDGAARADALRYLFDLRDDRP